MISFFIWKVLVYPSSRHVANGASSIVVIVVVVFFFSLLFTSCSVSNLSSYYFEL